LEKKGLFMNIGPLVDNEFREFRGLVLDENGKTGMALFGSSVPWIVIFDPIELIALKTIAFDRSCFDLRFGTVWDNITFFFFPIHLRNGLLELVLRTREPNAINHITAKYHKERLNVTAISVCECITEFGLEPSRICGRWQQRGCPSLIISGSRWDDQLGVYPTPEGRLAITNLSHFTGRAFVDVFLQSLQHFGLNEIWRKINFGNTPQEFHNLCISSQQDRLNIISKIEDNSPVPIMLNFDNEMPIVETPIVSILAKFYTLPAIVVAGSTDSSFDQRVQEFPEFQFLRMTGHLSAIVISVIGENGSSFLSCLTGIEFLQPPINTMVIGSTSTRFGSVESEQIINIIGCLFTIGSFPSAFLAAVSSSEVVCLLFDGGIQQVLTFWRNVFDLLDQSLIFAFLEFQIRRVRVVIVGNFGCDFESCINEMNEEFDRAGNRGPKIANLLESIAIELHEMHSSGILLACRVSDSIRFPQSMRNTLESVAVLRTAAAAFGCSIGSDPEEYCANVFQVKDGVK
jgi:hypothetical protein